jgi:aminoglycoside phosphotransferase (APT) family kinase protein
MALTHQRDADALRVAITGWLGEPLTSLERPTDGWSSETVLVRSAGRDVALRLPPLGEGIFPTYDLALQARAHDAAAAAGVPAPVPAELVDVGEPALAMPLVDGHVPGEMPAFDPWVVDHGTAAYEAVVDVLARLHAGDAAGVDLPHRSVEDELAWWSSYLDWCGADVPALAAALDACTDHRPGREPTPALLWGDVRLGNVVFDDAGAVVAVLDWEMATIGAPEHDLGWWWGLEAMQDELVGGRAEAFPTLDALRRRYEAAAGRELRDLDWYATFALFRSAAILTRIGVLQQRAGLPTRMPLDDNPVLDHLARRVADLRSGNAPSSGSRR